MNQSLKAQSLAGIGWLGSSAVARGTAQLFSIAILARLLEPTDFGIMAAALVVANFASVFSEMGVNAAIVQVRQLTASFETIAQIFSLGLSILISSFVVFGAPIISSWFGIAELTHILPWIAAGFLLKGISQVSEGKIHRELGFKRLARIEVFSFLVGYAAVAPGMAISGFGYWSLVGAYLAQTSSQALMCLVASPVRFDFNIRVHDVKAVLFFGNSLTLGRIFAYGAVNLDNIIVGRWLGADSLGLYSRAYQILVMPAALVGQVVARVMFPVFSSMQDDPLLSRKAFLTGTAAFSLVLWPAQVVLIVLSPELVRILLGPGWEPVVPVLQILFATLFFRTAYKLNEALLKSAGAVMSLAGAQSGYAAIVGLGALSAVGYGIIGVSVVVAVAVAFYYLTLLILIAKRCNIDLAAVAGAIFPGFVLALVMSIVAASIGFALSHIGWADLIARIAGLTMATAVAILMLFLAPRKVCGETGYGVVSEARRVFAKLFSRLFQKGLTS